MLERLSQADAQIRAFNQRLAAEIEAATHDLSEKNATLAQLNRLLNDMRLDNASKVRLATLGQLAAQLAHEIGTPLSSVSGHVQLALLRARSRRRRCASGWTSRRGRSSASARSCATTSIRPARWSRSASRPRCRACSRRRSRWCRASRRPSRRRIAWKVAPGLGDVVTDPGLLRQIVVNLLSNALDAVDRNGRVERARRSPRRRRRRCADHRQRHRPRHPARRPAPDLRAVLHDQGARQGDRPRPGHLPRS